MFVLKQIFVQFWVCLNFRCWSSLMSKLDLKFGFYIQFPPQSQLQRSGNRNPSPHKGIVLILFCFIPTCFHMLLYVFIMVVCRQLFYVIHRVLYSMVSVAQVLNMFCQKLEQAFNGPFWTSSNHYTMTYLKALRTLKNMSNTLWGFQRPYQTHVLSLSNPML